MRKRISFCSFQAIVYVGVGVADYLFNKMQWRCEAAAILIYT